MEKQHWKYSSDGFDGRPCLPFPRHRWHVSTCRLLVWPAESTSPLKSSLLAVLLVGCCWLIVGWLLVGWLLVGCWLVVVGCLLVAFVGWLLVLLVCWLVGFWLLLLQSYCSLSSKVPPVQHAGKTATPVVPKPGFGVEHSFPLMVFLIP